MPRIMSQHNPKSPRGVAAALAKEKEKRDLFARLTDGFLILSCATSLVVMLPRVQLARIQLQPL